MMKKYTKNIYKFYLFVVLFILASIGLTLWQYTTIHPIWIYLITITLITFCFYGYDKHQAIHQKNRIPEAVLHILSLSGGSAGAFAGQYVFRHKTKKLKFQVVFIFIAIVQLALILWWVMKDRT